MASRVDRQLESALIFAAPVCDLLLFARWFFEFSTWQKPLALVRSPFQVQSVSDPVKFLGESRSAMILYYLVSEEIFVLDPDPFQLFKFRLEFLARFSSSCMIEAKLFDDNSLDYL